MNKIFTKMAIAMAVVFVSPVFAQQPTKRCGTTEYMAKLIKADPTYKQRLDQMESQVAAYIAAHKNEVNRPHAVITIPTVVHIVYNGSSQDHSDASVQSQIDAMNADFRLMNSDKSSAPSVFQTLQGDAEIEFCLAQRDPDGNPSTGITRTSTNHSAFSDNDDVKYTSKGGHDAWPRDKYLNLWVCDLSNSLLGYAQFPGGSAATDGVVLHTTYFGTVKSQSPYNLGRTGTHEVGHWLGLYHIWGDSNCGNDQVSDTPTQQTSNTGCPSFPHVTCSNGPNGDMYVNYMDYVNDACMVMFSKGQVSRMQGVINGSRVSLQNSDGCIPPSAPPVAAFESDIQNSCSGAIQFYDKSTVGPTAWSWSFGDGNTSTQQNPQHTYEANGSFTVKLIVTNSYGQDSITKISYVTINRPNGPAATGDTICGSGTANLTASGNGGTYEWYDAPTGGTKVGTGATYGPSVTTTTTFYVQELVSQASVKGGPVDSALGGGGLFTNNDLRGLLFDASAAFTLKSVKVYAGAAGNRTIELLDGDGGNVLQTTTVNIPSGESRVTLDFPVAPGTGYFIKVTGTTIDLYRNNAGATYPIDVAGMASITGTNTSASGYYYYFYDWEVQEPSCLSLRTPVTATVGSDNLSVSNLTTDDHNGTCDGTAGVSVTGGTPPYSYAWDDASSQTAATATGLCAGNYSVTVTDAAGCDHVEATVVDLFTGLVQNLDGALQVFPNPSENGEVFVRSGVNGNAVVEVFNCLGERVVNREMEIRSHSVQRLSADPLAPGLYLINIRMGDQQTHLKLVVQ